MDPAFVRLLEQLTVADNAIRADAESAYKRLQQQQPEGANGGCDHLPLALYHVIGSTEVASHIRQLAAVLLRRLLIENNDTSAYHEMTDEGQHTLKSGLLHVLAAVEAEHTHTLKARVCDIVGELGGYIIEPEEWPEVLPFTHSQIVSSDSSAREIGFNLLGLLSNSHMEVLTANPVAIQAMVAVFNANLVSLDNDGRILLSAMRALAQIITSVSQDSTLGHFRDILQVMAASLGSINQAAAAGHLPPIVPVTFAEIMIEIVEEKCYFFEIYLNAFVEVVMEIIENGSTLPPSRRTLIEFLVALCVASPKKVRKIKTSSGEKYYFANRLFPVCAQMMAMVAVDPSWESADTAEEAVQEEIVDSDVAEAALSRMTVALGLPSTFAIASTNIGQLLSSSEWQYQLAGLRYIGNYMEVSARMQDKRQLVKHRQEVIATLLFFVQNTAVPRVKAASFAAISNLYCHHGRHLDGDQHEQVLQALLPQGSLAVNGSPRVRRAAFEAIRDVVYYCGSPAFLEGKVGSVLTGIVQGLTDGPMIVQEHCVSCIIAISEAVHSKQMAGFYDSLMPVLKALLTYSQQRGLEALWGQTLESCVILGESSGKGKFYPDALELMNLLVIVQSQLAEESTARKYLMKAWVRIARCIGSDFLPYLQAVMTDLITAISQDVTAGTGDIDLDDLEDRSDIEMIETSDGFFMAVRTAAVEEQSSACELMVLIIERLQEHFYPYVETVTRAMVPLLLSPHEDVRSYCMAVIPELVRSTAKATVPDRSAVQALTEFTIGHLLRAIEVESTPELVMTGLQALRHTLFYACTNWAAVLAEADGEFYGEPPALTPATSLPILNNAQMEALTQCTKIVLRESIQKRAVIRAEAQLAGGADEDDAVDEILFLQESLELHFSISDVFGAILRTHGSHYLGIYTSQWHEIVTDLSRPYCVKEDRQFALYLVSDIVEFALTVDTAPEYLAIIWPTLLETTGACTDVGPRQAASYILGVAASKHPAACATYFADALMALGKSIQMGDEGEELHGSCVDNSISALGLILQQAEAVGLAVEYEVYWDQWIAYLPLKHDLDEGRKVISQLIQLINSRPNIFTSTADRFIQGVSTVVAFLNSDLSCEEINNSILRCLQSLRMGISPISEESFQALLENMPSDLSLRLTAILTSIQMHDSISPGPSAPIHDVLWRP